MFHAHKLREIVLSRRLMACMSCFSSAVNPDVPEASVVPAPGEDAGNS